MKSKRLIVISLDALGSTDFEMFSQLPNFKKFIDHAAFCRQVRSVYPTVCGRMTKPLRRKLHRS